MNIGTVNGQMSLNMNNNNFSGINNVNSNGNSLGLGNDVNGGVSAQQAMKSNDPQMQ